jgi:large subunit ribosomal protein L18
MLKSIQKRKNKLRTQRKRRVRGKISGTVELPRVSVFKSNKHFYAQAIDDVAGVTLASVDGKKEGQKANKEAATAVAKIFADNLKAKGIEKVVLDRRGDKYHGVVAAFADGLRDNGITL